MNGIRSSGIVQSLSIPPQSRVFIQMPGDVVYEGILEPPPRGPTPTPENLSINHVLMRGSNSTILMTSVFFSRNYFHKYIRDYRCFIKTTDGTVFTAGLNRYHREYVQTVPNRIFVRLPIRGYPVYTGELHINDGYEPVWLHFTN